MKRKIFAVLLSGAMALSMLTACSNGERVETMSETKEEMNETVSEEITDEVSVTSPEPTEEPIPEQETFNEEMAMEKVQRAIDCYRKLMKSEDEATWNITDAIECLGKYNHYLDIRTSDGYYMYTDDGYATDSVIMAMGTMYYEYANGIIDEVIPMGEYIPSHTNEELLKYGERTDGSTGTDSLLMCTGMTAMNYLNHAQTIEVGDFIKLDEPLFYVCENMGVYYKVPLIVDGEDSRLFACYDENGMLIQISNEDDADWDKLGIRTFPGSENW